MWCRHKRARAILVLLPVGLLGLIACGGDSSPTGPDGEPLSEVPNSGDEMTRQEAEIVLNLVTDVNDDWHSWFELAFPDEEHRERQSVEFTEVVDCTGGSIDLEGVITVDDAAGTVAWDLFYRPNCGVRFGDFAGLSVEPGPGIAYDITQEWLGDDVELGGSFRDEAIHQGGVRWSHPDGRSGICKIDIRIEVTVANAGVTNDEVGRAEYDICGHQWTITEE